MKTETDPTAQIAAVRGALLEVDQDQPIYGIRTLEDSIDASVASRRLNAVLVSLFALLAALLATIGIYGIVSCYVVQRTAEIGLRRALGARQRDVLAMVIGRGLALTATGVVLGLAGAALVSRYLASLLFGITPTNATAFTVAPVLLLVIAALACYIPARRASRVDPMSALRAD